MDSIFQIIDKDMSLLSRLTTKKWTTLSVFKVIAFGILMFCLRVVADEGVNNLESHEEFPNEIDGGITQEDIDNMSVASMIDYIEKHNLANNTVITGSNRDSLIHFMKNALKDDNSSNNKLVSDSEEKLDETQETESNPSLYESLYLTNINEANMTVWELMKLQIRRDLAPFLLLIPPPIKRYIAQRFTVMMDSLVNVALGTFGPMLKTGGRLLQGLGQAFIAAGESLVTATEAHERITAAHPRYQHTNVSSTSYQDKILVVSEDEEVIELD